MYYEVKEWDITAIMVTDFVILHIYHFINLLITLLVTLQHCEKNKIYYGMWCAIKVQESVPWVLNTISASQWLSRYEYFKKTWPLRCFYFQEKRCNKLCSSYDLIFAKSYIVRRILIVYNRGSLSFKLYLRVFFTTFHYILLEHETWEIGVALCSVVNTLLMMNCRAAQGKPVQCSV